MGRVIALGGRLAVVAAAPLLAWPVASAAAEPVDRGQQPLDGPSQVCEEAGGQRQLTYALDPESSASNLVLRTASMKNLSLVFTSSCIVRAPEPEIDVSLEAGPADSADLPDELVSQARVSVRRDGLTVVFPIKRSALDPGQYDAHVVLSGDEVTTVRTPVTVSIKDGRWYAAFVAVLLGLAAGLAVAAFTAVTGNATNVADPIGQAWKLLRSGWGLAAAAAAIGLGYFWESGPFRSLVIGNDEWVWTLGDGMNLVVRAFGVAAGTGVIALFVSGLRNLGGSGGDDAPQTPRQPVSTGGG
ncbi:MAG TPA: hypothetical protein VFZ68_01720 [Acidimicrobiales bacterium]